MARGAGFHGTRTYTTAGTQSGTYQDTDGDGIDDGTAAYYDRVEPGWRDDPRKVERARADTVRHMANATPAFGQGFTQESANVYAEAQRRNDPDYVIGQLEGETPTVDDLRAHAEGYDPVLERETALRNAKADPLAVEAQRRALAGLAAASGARGLQATDRAALEGGIETENMQRQAQQRALMGIANDRGMRGGGAEVAGVAGAQGDMARGLVDRGLSAEQEAQQRALMLIGARSGLAGGMREQSFDEKMKLRETEDAIRRRNATRVNESREFGAGARNVAAAQNTRITPQLYDIRASQAEMRSGRMEAEQERRRLNAERADTERRQLIGAGTTLAEQGLSAAMEEDDDDDMEKR
jgi:hypothetical protein